MAEMVIYPKKSPLYGDDAAEAARSVIDWTSGGRVHNWRNHVGQRTKTIWHTLTPEQRVAIAEDAADEAGAEEWE